MDICAKKQTSIEVKGMSSLSPSLSPPQQQKMERESPESVIADLEKRGYKAVTIRQ